MTTRKRKSENTKPREGQAPALIAFHVTERNGKSYWTRIGAAWDHEDAKGLTMQLDLVPVNGGRIVLREPAADDGQTDEGEAA